MKKSTLIFSVLIFVLFCGCKRSIHDIKMHGYFYDEHTGVRLPNGHFNFTIYFYSPASGSEIAGEHYSGTTDANGYYELMIEDGDKRRQKYKYYKGDFFIDSVGAASFKIEPDFSERKEMNMDIGLDW